MKKAIVGVDPGLTSAIAAVTLNGEPLYIESGRGWGYREVLKKLTKTCEPVVVASDVNPPSDLVYKLASELNAILYIPLKILSLTEKRKLSREFIEKHKITLNNEHEVDALAAALKAFQYYKNKFSQIDAWIRNRGIKVPVEEVKAKVIKGMTVKKALETFMKKPLRDNRDTLHPPSKDATFKKYLREMSEQASKWRQKYEALLEINRKLEERLKKLEVENEELKNRLLRIKEKYKEETEKEREFYILVEDLKRRREKLNYYISKIESYEALLSKFRKTYRLRADKELILIKVLDSFTKECIEQAINNGRIRRNDVLMFKDSSGGGVSTAELLVELGVKAVITKNRMPHQALEVLSREEIPILQAEKLKLRWKGDSLYISSEELAQRIEEWRENERENVLNKIKAILEDYWRERWGDQ